MRRAIAFLGNLVVGAVILLVIPIAILLLGLPIAAVVKILDWAVQRI